LSNNDFNFKLIKGGLAETVNDSRKEFISACITDTRLMGVVGMYVQWALPDNIHLTHLHQFFYFDAEETGFDTYKSVLGDGSLKDFEEINDIENYLLGGLGGKKVNISEKEAMYMLQSYAALNARSELALPGEIDEYEFMLSPAIELSDSEAYALMCKQCPILDSPYQVINYFLMRCYGKDFGAAKFLTKGYVRTDIFPEHKGSTLLRNVIEEAPDEVSGTNTNYHTKDDSKDFGTFSTTKSYMCESLIEYRGKYFLIITQISLDHLKIVKFEKVSTFRISPAEASMMTSRGEFVTVLDLVPGAPNFTRHSTELVAKSMVTEYENGTLFMIFQPNNDHVKNSTYLLNDDVLGIYYLVDDSQLVLSAYSLENIRKLESDLETSDMARFLIPISKYEFKEPVIFDFISSLFDDFEDFVDAIAKPPLS
jgi:hypothetical protein